jgi:hypothetical protein
MNHIHIDEGTIHAWLDGALSADRAREVEAHVSHCASCSSAVAEARGLIAGASRILTALDDVPANVTPKRTSPAAPPKRQRQWRAAPWVTGIAAALILAVGLTTWNRDRANIMRSEMTAVESDRAGATAAAAQSLSDTASAAPAQEAKTAVANARTRGVARASAKQPVTTSRPLAASPQQRTTSRKLDVASPPPAAPSALATGGAASSLAATDTARSAERRQSSEFAAAAVPADTTRLRTTTSVTGTLVAPRDSTHRRRIGEGVSLRLEEVVVTGVGAKVASGFADARQAAGCYQLGKAVEESAGVTTMSDRVARAAAPSSDASRSAARQPARAEVVAPSVRATERVRLDTAQNRAGLMVRDGNSEVYIGTWQRVGDSVRVTIPSQGTFMLAAKDRVSCPER